MFVYFKQNRPNIIGCKFKKQKMNIYRADTTK